jgi:bifunctional DNase/RNase
MGKIKLNVLGISYSQTQSGAYALVLSEEEGNRRIPIIVGGFEAQAIAIELEGLAPPRPLTHDLFKNFAESYGITLIEVNIHKLEDGVFFANILCDNGGQRITLDARTSDAIALALRFTCPIYTTEAIVEKAGIVLDFEKGTEFEHPGATSDDEGESKIEKIQKGAPRTDLSKTSMEDLRSMLTEAVSNEDYEKASSIRDEINRRSK